MDVGIWTGQCQCRLENGEHGGNGDGIGPLDQTERTPGVGSCCGVWTGQCRLENGEHSGNGDGIGPLDQTKRRRG